MIGLITLDVYTSIFNITEEIIKFELYTDPFVEFSIDDLKDEPKEILTNSDITPYHLLKQ